MGLRCSQLETNQMSSARPCKKTYARLKTLRRSEMEIENLICYTERAVGLKPSAIQGKARLHGRERIISSKTIISVYALLETDAWCDTVDSDKSQGI